MDELEKLLEMLKAHGLTLTSYKCQGFEFEASMYEEAGARGQIGVSEVTFIGPDGKVVDPNDLDFLDEDPEDLN